MVDKSFMFYVLIIIASFYFFPKSTDRIKNYDNSYQSVNNLGVEILVVDHEPLSIQKMAWNKSSLKDDFLEFFPHFEDMKYFISERIVGDALQAYLYKKLDELEHQFFSGTISSQKAKWMFENLK